MQIKQWITFHDPYSFIYGGYGRKDMAPGINGPASTVYKAATNVLQAHAAVYNLYNQAYKNTQNGKNIDICSIVWLNFHFFLIEWYESVFQLDFKIFRTIVSFIKISSGQSLIIKLYFYKVLQDSLRNIWANVLRPVSSWSTGEWNSIHIRFTTCHTLFLIFLKHFSLFQVSFRF